ncbi:hypothetical protein HOA65_03530 [archaeon]|jgi:hypothetical protein|nr:hypothetical protein [archaeon]MBT7380349.1 hypothetical protein [archaeon]
MIKKLMHILNKKKEIIKFYIRKNPNCTYKEIRRHTKIKVERIYKNMKEAYIDAGVKLSKNLLKRNELQQRKEVVKFIKNNPTCTVSEIQIKLRVNIPRLYGSIINAYESAETNYPEREIDYGVRNPKVIKRCKIYESKVIKYLEKLGDVKPQVRVKNKIIDCLFCYNKKKFVVEIKDFRSRNNITKSQIKQLEQYMKLVGINNGLIICPKESFPKRNNHRNIYIENLNIKILSDEDIRGRSISYLLNAR